MDAPRLSVRGGMWLAGARTLAEETPVAIVHDAATYAVMLASPADLEDFAVGFSLTEGVIDRPDDVRAVDVVEGELGIELRLWLAPGCSAALLRRRTLTGPTGCGLCGIESLEALARTRVAPPAPIDALAPADIHAAAASLGAAQILGSATRAVHGAGLWRKSEGLVCLREDVGRHNAVDKLVGALARAGEPPAGVLVLTSRVSVELVEKAARTGFPVIVAISAPTALAVRTAEAAGLTLVGVARDDGFEVYCGAERLQLD